MMVSCDLTLTVYDDRQAAERFSGVLSVGMVGIDGISAFFSSALQSTIISSPSLVGFMSSALWALNVS